MMLEFKTMKSGISFGKLNKIGKNVLITIQTEKAT